MEVHSAELNVNSLDNVRITTACTIKSSVICHKHRLESQEMSCIPHPSSNLTRREEGGNRTQGICNCERTTEMSGDSVCGNSEIPFEVLKSTENSKSESCLCQGACQNSLPDPTAERGAPIRWDRFRTLTGMKPISANLIAVSSPLKKIRPDEIESYLEKYGEKADFWSRFQNKGFQVWQGGVCEYVYPRSVCKALTRIPDDYPYIQAMSVRCLIHTVAEIESINNTNGVKISITGKRPLKCRYSYGFFAMLNTFGTVLNTEVESRAPEFKCDVTYQHLVNAFAADLLLSGKAMFRNRFHVQIHETQGTRLVMKQLLSRVKFHFLNKPFATTFHCSLKETFERSSKQIHEAKNSFKSFHRIMLREKMLESLSYKHVSECVKSSSTDPNAKSENIGKSRHISVNVWTLIKLLEKIEQSTLHPKVVNFPGDLDLRLLKPIFIQRCQDITIRMNTIMEDIQSGVLKYIDDKQYVYKGYWLKHTMETFFTDKTLLFKMSQFDEGLYYKVRELQSLLFWKLLYITTRSLREPWRSIRAPSQECNQTTNGRSHTAADNTLSLRNDQGNLKGKIPIDFAKGTILKSSSTVLVMNAMNSNGEENSKVSDVSSLLSPDESEISYASKVFRIYEKVFETIAEITENEILSLLSYNVTRTSFENSQEQEGNQVLKRRNETYLNISEKRMRMNHSTRNPLVSVCQNIDNGLCEKNSQTFHKEIVPTNNCMSPILFIARTISEHTGSLTSEKKQMKGIDNLKVRGFSTKRDRFNSSEESRKDCNLVISGSSKDNCNVPSTTDSYDFSTYDIFILCEGQFEGNFRTTSNTPVSRPPNSECYCPSKGNLALNLGLASRPSGANCDDKPHADNFCQQGIFSPNGSLPDLSSSHPFNSDSPESLVREKRLKGNSAGIMLLCDPMSLYRSLKPHIVLQKKLNETAEFETQFNKPELLIPSPILLESRFTTKNRSNFEFRKTDVLKDTCMPSLCHSSDVEMSDQFHVSVNQESNSEYKNDTFRFDLEQCMEHFYKSIEVDYSADFK